MSTNNAVALADFCTVVQGGRHKLSGNDFVPKGYPAYGAGGMNGYLPVREFDRAAVVLSSIGARCGKCFYADGEWTSLANTQVILPDPAKADTRFLWHQLNDEARWPRSGTAQPFIKPSDVKAHCVFLPPLTEQRRIATILDEAYALRAKRRTTLAQLDDVTLAVFVEMFGDLEPSTCKWPSRSFEDIAADTRIGLVRAAEELSPEHPYPYLRMNAIGLRANIDLSSATRTLATDAEVAAYSLRYGDFLFNTRNSRELVGKTALFRSDDRYLFNNNIMRIRFQHGVKPDYVLTAMQTPAMKRALETKKSGTTSVFAVYWKDLKTLRVPLPPPERQAEFARCVQQMQEVVGRFLASAASLDTFFASVQHRAFRGEL